jgi:Family of unknown function (DUF6042)
MSEPGTGAGWQRQPSESFLDNWFWPEPDHPPWAAGKVLKARMNAWAARLGAGPVETVGDLLAFMVACGVVRRHEVNGQVRYGKSPDPHSPLEVLPLTSAERFGINLRVLELGARYVSDMIIHKFDPDGRRLTRIRTSVERLAREVHVDEPEARRGLAVLLMYGDFTAPIDPLTAAAHKVFEINVDWREYDSLTATSS